MAPAHLKNAPCLTLPDNTALSGIMTHNTIIKICGIRDAHVLAAAIAAGADMVGFVHFAKSPRHLNLAEIAELISLARGRVKTVVLLVDPDNSLIEKVAACAPDIIQLHGGETPPRIDEIRLKTSIALMKALPVGSARDLLALKAYSGHIDRLLLDAKAPKDAKRPGGLGRIFDWNLLKALDGQVDYMLSGGLTPDNVANAIRQVRPAGVDVSSGVERAPGKKDIALIRDFINNARLPVPEIPPERASNDG